MESYQLQQTSDRDLFRVVDLSGSWRFYYSKKAKKYLLGVTTVLDMGYAKGQRFYEYLKNGNKEEIESKLEKAGDKGDAVHQLISMFLATGKSAMTDDILAENNKTRRKPTVEEWKAFLTFTEFWKAHDPKLYANEFVISNLKFGYAGTVDMVIELTKKCDYKLCGCGKVIGQLGVWDHKSGGAIYNSYGPQIAAYAQADQMRKAKRKPTYTAIDRLGTRHARGYELEFYDKMETKTHWQEFLAALTIAKSEFKPFDPKKEIYDIIESVELTIKKHDTNSKTDKVLPKLGK